MLRAMISPRALVLFLVACGSSSNSGGGDKLTSLPDTKTMGELTDVEKKQLCEDFKAFQKKMRPTDDEMLRMTCQAKAAMASMGDTTSTDNAALHASCKKELDACIAKKEPMQEPELDCSNPQFLGKMSECKQVTIAEMTDCVRDMAGVMKKMAGEDLCAGVKVGDKTAVMKIFDKLKSEKCEKLEAKCGAGSGAAIDRPADPKLEAETITAVTGFKDQMCKCADQACAEKVRAEFTTWGEQMQAKHAAFQPSAEATSKVTALINDYTNCMLKIAGPPTTGSAK